MNRIIGLIVLVTIFCAGCASTQKGPVQEEYVLSNTLKYAVCPFYYDHKDKRDMARTLREIFTTDLLEDGLIIRKKTSVDSLLAEQGIQIGQFDLEEMVRIGKLLGVDIVIYGEITKRSKLYALVHSNITLAAKIVLVDVNKAEIITEYEKEEYRNAGLLRIPTGYVAAAVAPIKGLQKKFEDKLTFKLAKKCAEPIANAFSKDKNSLSTPPPQIQDVSYEIVENTAKNTVRIDMGVVGDHGCKVMVYVNDSKEGYPLTHAEGEHYKGKIELPFSRDQINNEVLVKIVNSNSVDSVKAISLK
ncbi:MAG: hypothetical protein P9M13_09675 [Candidatus Ancaeobacter aquaticus]|nr:hypothetical protein [Candidatus Ancaeobacter aquaticus]